MLSDDDEIRQALSQLVGLKLTAARRAADMRVFQFGELRPATNSTLPSRENMPRGTIGEFALHIQCPWRIASHNKIITGRSDLWEPIEHPNGFLYDEWDYERDGNLQDHLIERFMADRNDLFVKAVNTE